MPKDAREVIAGLEKKGFRRRDNDHAFLHLWVDGKKTPVYTKVSHGEKEIGDKLLGMMARQVRLVRKQFLELVECPLKLDEYIAILRREGHVASPPLTTMRNASERP